VAVQLELFSETAVNPLGADGGADSDGSDSATSAVPESEIDRDAQLPAMTMEEVASPENLRRAFERVWVNKGAPGPDRKTIEWVRARLDWILPAVIRDLRSGRYQPGMVRRVWIPKAGGGERGLGIPNVVDRMIQQAVLQVMEPHWEPTFHASSHGFRPGRSCHTAIAEARMHLSKGFDWVVDLDLEKFFDRVPHDRLMSRLETRIRDRALLGLIRRMLKAKVVMPDGVVVGTEEGTPQGGPLSPLLSNIVLDELDRELSRRGYRFVRYADDCNIYVGSERAGKRVMESVTRFIESRLRLKVNLAKSAVARPEERHFLGFRIRRKPGSTSTEVWLSKRSKERIYENIRRLTPRTWGRSLSDCIRRLNVFLSGWFGFFRICTVSEVATFDSIDGHIRRRLRAIVLRHWKRRRSISRRILRARGKPGAARSIYRGRRSWWALSHHTAVETALPNRIFEERGLRSIGWMLDRATCGLSIVPAPGGRMSCGSKGRRRYTGHSPNPGAPKSRM
jgi:group II intron reverse transcriptase/maturase